MNTAGTPVNHMRRLGTTLIEVLVVIVVFTIGILAVAQIFPKGFRILDQSRRTAVAVALARDLGEQLKAHPESLPEEIVPVAEDGSGLLVVDPARSPYDLGPQGQLLTQAGVLTSASNVAFGDWQRLTGANVMRRVIGESAKISAPRQVGLTPEYYGSPTILQFGPIDYRPGSGNMSVYGNDLVSHQGLPAAGDVRDDSEYFITNANTASISLSLPSGETGRNYRVSFSAYVTVGGQTQRQEFIGLGPVNVAAQTPANGEYPLVTVALQTLINPTPLLSVDTSTIRVQRFFDQIAKNASFVAAGETVPNPYKFKLLNESLGVLLFSPEAYNVSVLKPDGRHEALIARVNYDVYDWRIIREDFRVTSETPSLHELAVRGMKVSNEQGPDGRPNGLMFGEAAPATAGFADMSSANAIASDNFMLVDLDTGGVYCEISKTVAGKRLISVDKSLGVITFTTLDASQAGTIGELLLPDGNTRSVKLDGRAVRALYMTKNEFSAQVLKGAAQYRRATAPTNLGTAEYYAGPLGDATKIYFSRSNQGRKINVGEIHYFRAGETTARALYSQDFLVDFPRVDASGLGLPAIDLKDVDPLAASLDYTSGYAARDIKGASIAVRVLWNPEIFRLQASPAANMTALEQWGRNWRRSTDDTFIVRAEVIR